MQGMRSESRLVERVCEAGLLAQEPFTLLDVGCSGGLVQGARAFGDALVAIGVDPNVSEIERLQREETVDGVSYLAGYIGLPPGHPFLVARGDRDWWGNNPWGRLSTAEFASALAAATADERELTAINAWGLVRQAEEPQSWTVDEIVDERLGRPPDFVKIDIDGADLAAIASGGVTLADPGTLGVGAEVNFFGTEDPTDNTFHNVDRQLRAHGFELFDLSVRRYSAAALPAPFELGFPAQTQFGRILQGDALYLRDLAAPANSHLLEAASVPSVLKLACLFDLFGLPDCAAEVIVAAAPRLVGTVRSEELLDAVTLGVYPNAGSHAALAEAWRAQPAAFLARS